MVNTENVHNTRKNWPLDSLESVPCCPVCASCNRTILHKGLTDKIFFCAPGNWTMYSCNACNSAYLDPRPSLESIGMAYQNYYTHNEVQDYKSLSLANKIRRRLANGYRNYRYGTKDYPMSNLGILVAGIMPNIKSAIDTGMRHLPRVKAGMSLLDIGCGNGSFLLRAKSAGWEVLGIDLDENAVKVARGKGLDVRLGGIGLLDPIKDQFDVITMAHFIEHVHHPSNVLKECYALLKKEGFLWIDTPNINSEGHKLFGSDWRGLEPPRHLVLFNLDSMRSALIKAGFVDIEIQNYRPLCAELFSASKAISDGVNPYNAKFKKELLKDVNEAEKKEKFDPNIREFITVKAYKK